MVGVLPYMKRGRAWVYLNFLCTVFVRTNFSSLSFCHGLMRVCVLVYNNFWKHLLSSQGATRTSGQTVRVSDSMLAACSPRVVKRENHDDHVMFAGPPSS